MKNQQGAALVIVMALLSGALIIGISGMNSALIDERLAGNYRAVALAQMAAEWGGSDLDQGNIDGSRVEGRCFDLVNSDAEVNWEGGNVIDDSPSSYSYVTCNNARGDLFLLVRGEVINASSFSYILLGFPDLVEGDIDDFFEWVNENSGDFDYACDSSGLSGPGIYYCDKDFTETIDNSFDGVIVIVDGKVESNVNQPGNSNVDIDIGFIVSDKSADSVIFKGIGSKDNFTGFVWAGGEVTLSGGGNDDYIIDVCAEDITINGGRHAGDFSCDWIKDWIESSGLDYEAEGGGKSWEQL